MQYEKSNRPRNHSPFLTAIAGGSEKNALYDLTHIAWVFVTSCLYNCTQFSSKEQQASKEHILSALRLSNNPRRAFQSFCERILIAQQHRLTANDPLSLPSWWLDRDNVHGFYTTRLPYIQMKAIRTSLPLYKYAWKALVEAVLDFGEEPTPENFRYWKNYLTEKQEVDLLQLFQVFVSNFHFSI